MSVDFLSNFPTILLYTDPGSGALLLQLLAASLLGGLFYIRKFKTAVVRLITGKSERSDDSVTPKAE